MLACSKIRRHIFLLPDDALFNNRDFLRYASRASVDCTLSTMCKKGIIVREARGVYRKFSALPSPSIFQIALFKAQVFGRRIVKDFVDCAKELALCALGNRELTFITDGPSSSFATESGIRIVLKNRCARKVALDDGLIATAIKALWYFGNPLKPVHLMVATAKFGRIEGREFRDKASLMPAWMADVLSKPAVKPVSLKEQMIKLERDKRVEQYESMRKFLTPPGGDGQLNEPPDDQNPHIENPDTYDGELGYDGDYSHLYD
jgi:hypothetical protein